MRDKFCSMRNIATALRSAPRIVLLLCLTVHVAACSDGGSDTSSATFEPIEPPAGFVDLFAHAISGDGSTVVGSIWREPAEGEEGFRAVYWSPDDGVVELGFPGEATAVSQDGAVIGGWLRDPPALSGARRPFRWTRSSDVEILGAPQFSLSAVTAMDRTGRYLALYSQEPGGPFASFLWDAAAGADLTPYPPGAPPPVSTFVEALSPDASIAAGIRRTVDGEDSLLWNASGVSVLPVHGSYTCDPEAISSDARVIAGSCWVLIGANGFVTRSYSAAAWIDGVLQILEPLDGEESSFSSDVSADGEVIVGTALVDGRSQTTIWRAATGKVPLEDILRDAGLADAIAGWALLIASSISDDGRVVAGNGIAPNGTEAAFRAILPAQD
jgi:uncharacterized membrane protein